MGAMVSQITNLTIVYSAVYSVADQRKEERLPADWPSGDKVPVLYLNPFTFVFQVTLKPPSISHVLHYVASPGMWSFMAGRINTIL